MGKGYAWVCECTIVGKGYRVCECAIVGKGYGMCECAIVAKSVHC